MKPVHYNHFPFEFPNCGTVISTSHTAQSFGNKADMPFTTLMQTIFSNTVWSLINTAYVVQIFSTQRISKHPKPQDLLAFYCQIGEVLF
jgi:hypothetical protein